MAKRIGELLVEAGVLSQSQLEQALFAQRKDGRKLGQLLIELSFVSEVQLTQTLSRQLSVPWVSLYHVDFSRSLLNLVAREIAERYSLVPIFVRRERKQGETLYVAMDDPTNEAAIEEVAKAASLPVKPMIACPSDIRAAIRVYYLGEPAPPPAVSLAPAPQPSAPRAVPSDTTRGAPSAIPEGPRTRKEGVVLEAVPRPLPTAPTGGPPAAAASPPASQAPKPAAAESKADDDAPEIEATERELPKRPRAKMISLTLLDGTTVAIPSGRKSRPDTEAAPSEERSDQFTARDLVSALRAVAHGADASEILGTEPKWEAMFSVLLSILLRKGLIADWEFVEEFRKI